MHNTATLADEADTAATCNGSLRRLRSSPLVGLITPETVRSDDAHIAALGMLQNLAFQYHAFRTNFLKARRNNDGAFDAQIDRVLDDARNGGSRCDHNDQIHNFGNSGKGGISLDAENA